MSFRETLEKMEKFHVEHVVEHPKWERRKYDMYSKNYDKGYAFKRRTYLLKLSDFEAHNLEHFDMYDRLKFISEKTSDEERRAHAIATKSEKVVAIAKPKEKDVKPSWYDKPWVD